MIARKHMFGNVSLRLLILKLIQNEELQKSNNIPANIQIILFCCNPGAWSFVDPRLHRARCIVCSLFVSHLIFQFSSSCGVFTFVLCSLCSRLN